MPGGPRTFGAYGRVPALVWPDFTDNPISWAIRMVRFCPIVRPLLPSLAVVTALALALVTATVALLTPASLTSVLTSPRLGAVLTLLGLGAGSIISTPDRLLIAAPLVVISVLVLVSHGCVRSGPDRGCQLQRKAARGGNRAKGRGHRGAATEQALAEQDRQEYTGRVAYSLHSLAVLPPGYGV